MQTDYAEQKIDNYKLDEGLACMRGCMVAIAMELAVIAIVLLAIGISLFVR